MLTFDNDWGVHGPSTIAAEQDAVVKDEQHVVVAPHRAVVVLAMPQLLRN